MVLSQSIENRSNVIRLTSLKVAVISSSPGEQSSFQTDISCLKIHLAPFPKAVVW